MKKEKSRNKSSWQLCWNCGSSEHALRDCKQPRNGKKIAKNRKLFISTKPNSG